MRSCPDVCDEVINRLKKLGFTIDDTEDHEPIFTALAEVQFALISPADWVVSIQVTQLVTDAELEEEDREANPAGSYTEEVETCCEVDAVERAKDQFHDRVPIATLEDFRIDYTASLRAKNPVHS